MIAQDDLDNLLNDLESEGTSAEETKAQPKAAEESPAAEPAKEEAAEPEVKEEAKAEEKAEEKKEEVAEAEAEEKEEAPAAEPAKEEKKEEVAEAETEETSEPEVKEEAKAEEKKEEVAEAETEEKEEAPAAEPAKEEKKEEVAEAPAAEEKKEEVAEAEEEKEEAPAAEEKKEAKKEVAEAEEAEEEDEEEEEEEAPPAKKAKPAAVAKKAEPEAKKAPPPHPDQELLSDIMATEALNRESMQRQIMGEIEDARAARAARDWETMHRKYSIALRYLAMRADLVALRRECEQGMAEARYQEAKQMLRESNRTRALELAEDALALRHPHAGAMVDALKAEASAETETDASEIRHRRNEDEYKMERNEIRSHLRRSAQFMAVGEYDQAIEECDLVIRYHPYNKEAISLRKRIQKKREMTLDSEREATRRGMIADVGAAWRPVYAVNSSKLKASDGGTMKTAVGGGGELSVEQSIEKRMKEMMLPSISFRQPATIFDAVEFFIQASKDYDRPDLPIEQRGFNFVLYPPTGGVKVAQDAGGGNENAFAAAASDDGGAATGAGGYPVLSSISATNVSLWEALSLVCKLSEFKFIIQGSVVQVMHKNQTTEEMITRSYTIVEDFLERMNDASSGLKDAKAGDFGGGGGGDEGGASNDEAAWQQYFKEMGVDWPERSRIKYIKAIGKLRVTNTADQLAIFEQALNELNVTPRLVEIETRFVEVAQEDLNSLGFEWLLNSDYSFNVGGKLAKALNLKDSGFGTTESEMKLTDWTVNRVNTSNKNTYYKPDGTQITDASAAGTGGGVLPNGNTGSDLVSDFNGTIQNNMVTSTKNWTYQPGTYGYYRNNGQDMESWKTRGNLGVNAIGGSGSSYHTGMRYLSTQGNHISGEGMSNNDQFMRVNAFLGNADLSMILHMLSQRSDTDLLSAPKVVTKSGNEATIKVVTIYRYPQDYDVTIQSTSSGSSGGSTSSSGGGSGKILPMVEPQNFETQEVGVILTVTPEVTAEGQMINLQLNPKVISEPTWHNYGMRIPKSAVQGDSPMISLFGGSSSNGSTVNIIDPAVIDKILASEEAKANEWFDVPMEQPFFKERSIDTKISIYNGATVVMGGLITEERKSMEDKIPFLGDIPFIGRLFRSRSEWSNKRNLLIFVTARLVDPRGRQIQFSAGDEDGTEKAASAAPAAEGK